MTLPVKPLSKHVYGCLEEAVFDLTCAGVNVLIHTVCILAQGGPGDRRASSGLMAESDSCRMQGVLPLSTLFRPLLLHLPLQTLALCSNVSQVCSQLVHGAAYIKTTT